jgi:hypothetical protein
MSKTKLSEDDSRQLQSLKDKAAALEQKLKSIKPGSTVDQQDDIATVRTKRHLEEVRKEISILENGKSA